MIKRFAVILFTAFLVVGHAGIVCGESLTFDTITAKEHQVFEGGTKWKYGDVSVVDLHGTWHEMGRQYGCLMKEELEDVYAFVELMTEVHEGNADKAEAIAETQTQQTPYRISEFINGASETSGFTPEKLQLINAVERIGGLPHCSVAMAYDSYTIDGKMVIGRNYDYSDIFEQLYEDVAVTVYHPADGALATATVGYAGEIYAVNGLNEKGLFLELNNGKPSANVKPDSARVTGTTLLFSALFEADTLEDFELFFNTMLCSSSYIINVADQNEGHSYEWCPTGVKRGDKEKPDDLIVSTNYYLNPEWEYPDPSDEECWEGITRRNNLIKLSNAAKGKIDAKKMMEIIATPIKKGGAEDDLTVYQLVVIPENLDIWVRVTDSPNPVWTCIDLSGILDAVGKEARP